MDKHPNRNFEGLAENLLAQDFFCIDELQHEGEAVFQAEPYALSQGNVKFIVQKCQNSVLKGKNTFQEVWKECRQVSGFGVVSSEK